jgi:hypothetical protein
MKIKYAHQSPNFIKNPYLPLILKLVQMKLLYILFFCLISSLTIAQNSALIFDGTDEFLSIPHNDDYNIGDGFTIEAWIFANEWQQASWQGSILNKDNQGPDRGYAFRCGDNGILSFVMSVDNTWEEAFTGQIMNVNQWHHVAVVINDGTITLYIDGQASASHSFSGTPSAASDLPLNIGASPGFGSRHFNGVIDEVRIWNDARTQTELVDNMTVDLSGNEANLVGYFPMNEGMGTVTNDLSPNANNAQFNEMDESNWVDGYTLPDFDASVQDVFGIDVVNMIDRPVKLSANILNTGVMAISDINLEVWLNGDFYLSENVEASIEPGELYTHEFSVPIDLVGLTDPEIEVLLNQTDDGNALNNSGSLLIKTGTAENIIVSDMNFHNFGQQNNNFKLTLPNDLHKYEQLLLNIDLTCPAGGCAPWDVLADLKAITPSGTYELARYITPYGIACGGWVVDITDFKSILGGEIEFRTSIIVFTQQGWLVDMSIDLIDNDNEHTFTQIERLWETEYHVYGDSGINDDLDPVEVDFADNTEESHVRMTITGHGQGNTNNAAEFFNVTHQLTADGSPYQDHNVWKSDCASNPCDDQAGTWLFSRAGWCPGQDVAPKIIDTDNLIEPGGTVSLDYELQDYTNLLNTGYNGSTHTEPFYRIYSYFIEQSSTPYKDFKNLLTESVESSFSGSMFENATVEITNNGFETMEGFILNIYHNSQLVATQSFDDNVETGSTISKQIDVNTNVDISQNNIVFAEVVNESDDNPGDNVIRASLATHTDEVTMPHRFELYPNPTTNGEVFLKYDSFWKGSLVKIYSTNGAIVTSFIVNDDITHINLPNSGMYWYVLNHSDGYQQSGKITVINQ